MSASSRFQPARQLARFVWTSSDSACLRAWSQSGGRVELGTRADCTSEPAEAPLRVLCRCTRHVHELCLHKLRGFQGLHLSLT